MGITVWRVIAALPALAFSLWIWLLMWALAPGYVSAAVTAVWVATLAAAPTRAGQNALMWLLPARAPNAAEQRAMGDSIVRMRQIEPATARLGVRVVGMPGIAAAGSGRYNIVVTRDAVRALQASRLPEDQMTALLVSAAGQVVRRPAAPEADVGAADAEIAVQLLEAGDQHLDAVSGAGGCEVVGAVRESHDCDSGQIRRGEIL